MLDPSFLVCPSRQLVRESVVATPAAEAATTGGSEGAGAVERQVARPWLGCHLLRKPFYLPASVSPLQSGANMLGQR